MKIFILLLIGSTYSFATCFQQRTLCVSKTVFENTYEISKVSCSPPGGPVSVTTHLNIYNKLAGVKPLISKRFNTTRDRYFQAEISAVGKTFYLAIDDRSVNTESNINISTAATSPKELFGYVCKGMLR